MDSNVLIVSEKDQKAYLPYKCKDIENFLNIFPDKYNTPKEVIEDIYIVPLDSFKNAPLSRFREAFNLVLRKEKGSIIKAFDLALELMFKYNLNPIIVAACRTLDELDIYLDCLDENELFDFKCFEVRFEVCPNIYKKPIKEFYF